MSRTVTSPVKRWPGTVTLADPLNFPQYIAWKDAIKSAPDPAADYDRYCAALLPGVIACVEVWSLEGIGTPTPDTFPAVPPLDRDQLLVWLIRNIRGVINATDAPDPN